MKMILQKLIAHSGYCSRRQAEDLIRNGRVKVNGKTALIGEQADIETDKIMIKNFLISKDAEKIYLKLNKPLGYTCTNRSFAGEKNIFDLIKIPERLFAVGRLDKESSGLILLTNDGDLAQKLAHPSFKHDKVYQVRIKGEFRKGDLIAKQLMSGVNIGMGDGTVKARNAKYIDNNLFLVTLNDGKKRQIRRMFKAVDLIVDDLRRTNLAGLALGALKEGAWAYLTKEEIGKLTE